MVDVVLPVKEAPTLCPRKDGQHQPGQDFYLWNVNICNLGPF